jgi:hypothetical protein
MRIHRRTTTNLEELAEWINPIVRGWMNYYGEFNRVEMYHLLRRIHTYLMRWARKSSDDYAHSNDSRTGGIGWSSESLISSPTGHGCARSHGLDEKSGMTGDCHVPFRGSPGVRFPWATRLRGLSLTISIWSPYSAAIASRWERSACMDRTILPKNRLRLV